MKSRRTAKMEAKQGTAPHSLSTDPSLEIQGLADKTSPEPPCICHPPPTHSGTLLLVICMPATCPSGLPRISLHVRCPVPLPPTHLENLVHTTLHFQAALRVSTTHHLLSLLPCNPHTLDQPTHPCANVLSKVNISKWQDKFRVI